MKSSVTIEKKFNQIKEDIRKKVFSDPPKYPSDDIYNKLINEYQNVKIEYEQINDNVNLIFVKHNFYLFICFKDIYK